MPTDQQPANPEQAASVPASGDVCPYCGAKELWRHSLQIQFDCGTALVEGVLRESEGCRINTACARRTIAITQCLAAAEALAKSRLDRMADFRRDRDMADARCQQESARADKAEALAAERGKRIEELERQCDLEHVRFGKTETLQQQLSERDERLRETVGALTEALEIFKTADDERLVGTKAFRDEADKWKREGDMYGWNFHMGTSSGLTQGSIYFYRVYRFIKAWLARHATPEVPENKEST